MWRELRRPAVEGTEGCSLALCGKVQAMSMHHRTRKLLRLGLADCLQAVWSLFCSTPRRSAVSCKLVSPKVVSCSTGCESLETSRQSTIPAVSISSTDISALFPPSCTNTQETPFGLLFHIPAYTDQKVSKLNGNLLRAQNWLRPTAKKGKICKWTQCFGQIISPLMEIERHNRCKPQLTTYLSPQTKFQERLQVFVKSK